MRASLVLMLLLLGLSPRSAAGQGRVLDSYGPGMRSTQAAYKQQVMLELVGVLGQWRSAWEAADPDAITRLYSKDAVLMSNDGTVVTGRKAIREHMRALLQPGGSVRVSTPLSFDLSGDLGVIGYRTTHATRPAAEAEEVAMMSFRRGSFGGWEIGSHLIQ